MRLLYCDEDNVFRLTDDRSNDLPNYAILSHRWRSQEEELNFLDIINSTGSEKRGYSKLVFCHRQAKLHDLRYFWVDTCCINKDSASELSKAITSMYSWYANASRCFALLEDVEMSELGKEIRAQWEPQFRLSRWFTRGWTLQELLAPSTVEFFDQAGQFLGTKHKLEEIVHEITGIDIPALNGRPLHEFSVARRF